MLFYFRYKTAHHDRYNFMNSIKQTILKILRFHFLSDKILNLQLYSFLILLNFPTDHPHVVLQINDMLLGNGFKYEFNCIGEMKTQMNQDYIYKLKTIIFGDKGVGKSTIIQTYLHNHIPNTLPPNQDIAIYIKREDYSRSHTKKLDRLVSEERIEVEQPVYQCHFHIWDICGSICNRQTLGKLKNQKFYDNAAALVFVFKDQQSFKFIKDKVIPNIPRLQASSRQDQYLIYNSFKSDFSKKLQQQAQKYASKQMIYQRLQSKQVKDVRQIFQNILKNCVFKISDGVLTNSILKDRNNKIILKDFRQQSEDYKRRYNRCC